MNHDVVIWHLYFPFCKLCPGLVNLFDIGGWDLGLIQWTNTSSFKCTLSLLVMLLIFVCRCSFFLNGVQPPYPIYSSFSASMNVSPTACNISALMLSATPRNFLYSMTFLAFFLSFASIKGWVFTQMVSWHPLGSLEIIHFMVGLPITMPYLFHPKTVTKNPYLHSFSTISSLVFILSALWTYSYSRLLTLPFPGSPMLLVISSAVSLARISSHTVMVGVIN